MTGAGVLPDLPAGLTARVLTLADAPAVTALMAACELHDDGRVEIEESDLVADWQRPSFDLAAGSVGVFAGDRIVAYADLFLGRRAEAYVHPDVRGRGIGAALLRWTWRAAAAAGGTLVGQTVSDANTGAVALFQAHGYAPLWTSWVLSIDLPERPPAPDWPPGHTVRAFDAERDAATAYRLIEDAFNEWPDRDPQSFEDWCARGIGRDGFEPWQVQLLDRGSEAVGVVLLLDYDAPGGYVDQLAVRRDCRGQGLGGALLQHAFGVVWDRGERSCTLNTDSRTGALGLYEHVGMRVTTSYRHWARTLDPSA